MFITFGGTISLIMIEVIILLKEELFLIEVKTNWGQQTQDVGDF